MAVVALAINVVVNGFGFENLTAGFLKNLFGRSEPDGDFRESGFYFVVFSKSHIDIG